MKLTPESIKVLESRYELFQKHFKNKTDSFKLQGQTQIDDDMIEVKPILDQEYVEFFRVREIIGDHRAVAKLWFSKVGKGRFVFVKESGLWYEWSGLIWEVLSKESPGIKAMNLLTDDITIFLANVSECNEIETTIQDIIKKNIVDLIKKFNSNVKLCNDVLQRALADFSKDLIIDAMDTQMKYLTFKNNIVLNTKTLEYTNCKSYYYQTRMLPYDFPVSFSMYKDCPLWKKSVKEILEDDEDVITFIQNYSGYCLYPNKIDEKMLIMIGSGSNGKSVICNTLSKVLDCFSQVYEQEILNNKTDQREVNQLKVQLKGKYFALIKETPNNMTLNEPVVKSLVSRDEISGRALYHDTITFKPSTSFVLMTNHQPKIMNNDLGIKRRIIMLSFDKQFIGNEKNANLEYELKDEYEGIMHWVLEGLIMCKINLETSSSGCLDIPEKLKQDTDNYFTGDNLLELFYRKYFKKANKTDKIPVSQVYCLYSDFTNENENDFEKDRYEVIKNKTIDNFLKQKGHKIEKSTGNKRYVFGMSLITENNYKDEPNDNIIAEGASPEELIWDNDEEDDVC